MADRPNSKFERGVYVVAKWWAIFFGCIAVAALVAGITGMAIDPDARPDPSAYPARFLVIAMVAIGWALPAWLALMIEIARR